MAVATSGSTEFVDMNNLNLPYLGYGQIAGSSTTSIGVDYGGGLGNLLEGNFTYDAGGLINGGTVTGFKEYYAGLLSFEVTGLSIPATMLNTWGQTVDVAGVNNAVFGGNDQISGSIAGDYLVGFGGNDTLSGGDGPDSLDGSAGNDSILGGSGADYVRGLDDNDTIDGAADGDDVNGNQGVDLVRGGDGADSVRGGQGNDSVYGDAGDDAHVNGNIGDDRVFGGTGSDTVFGGQGSDTLAGEDGADWLSGDLGNDSMVGGTGADRFLFRVGSGVDTVGDFSAAEGDRVQLAVGQAYTLSTGGGGAIISLSATDQIVLTGVAAVQADWIVFV